MFLQIKNLDDELKLRAAAELELRERIGGNLHKFAGEVNPRFQWYRHCNVLGNVLERVSSGELKRVMVFEPPRHGKSELVSKLFPAYHLYNHPGANIGLTSYAAEIATGHSRYARDYYERAGKKYRFDVSAPREWHTEDEGIMWATGVGGPITGRGYDVGIIDDPFKNHEEADSPRIRESRWDWYQSTFYTRQGVDAAIILIFTRWHEDDLAARLFRQEREDPQNAEHWHVVVFDALRSSAPFDIPKTCTIEPDWREEGEPLCPERYGKEKLEKIQRKSSRVFLSLFQQRPTPEQGAIWKRQWFRPYQVGTEPKLEDDGWDWDLAYTENDENSASAFVRSAREKGGTRIFISDLGFRWFEFPELIKWMKMKDGPHYIEAKASGKSAKQTLSRQLIRADEVTIGGADKISRTRLATPIAEEGNVFVAAHLLPLLLDDDKQGVLRFPRGMNDDLNDALVQALNRHSEPIKKLVFA